MRFYVTVPALDGAAEVTLTHWLVAEGELVEADQPIAELAHEEATLELLATASGCLVARLVEDGASCQVGDVIGEIDPTAGTATRDSVPSLFTSFATSGRAARSESWRVRLVAVPDDVDEIDVEAGWEPIGVDGGKLVLRRRI